MHSSRALRPRGTLRSGITVRILGAHRTDRTRPVPANVRPFRRRGGLPAASFHSCE
jgi:hypothetical protein